MPPKPIGTRAMTGAERQARWLERQKAVEERLEKTRLETIQELRARVAELEAELAQVRPALKK